MARHQTVGVYHGFGFDVLAWVRGKIDCLDSRDSGEGFGGVGRMRDGFL